MILNFYHNIFVLYLTFFSEYLSMMLLEKDLFISNSMTLIVHTFWHQVIYTT